MMQLLSHIETANELTAYLGQKVVSALHRVGKDCIVVYGTSYIFNVPIPADFTSHEHEEADTLLVLYGICMAKEDPFQEFVFLLLIHCLEQAKQQMCDINARSAVEALGSAAILGFHNFTDCDLTAKFYGKSKLTCWKLLIPLVSCEIKMTTFIQI